MDFTSSFDRHPFLLKRLVRGERFKFLEFGEVFDVIVSAQFLSDERCEGRVCRQEPTTGCDSIGDVCEFIDSKDFDKVLEDGGFN